MYALALVTAYSPDCVGCSGIMKSGLWADHTQHYVAADLRYWDIGDRIELCLETGPVIFMVADTGGAIKGRWRFDMLVATEDEAISWGVKRVHARHEGQ